MAPQSLSASIEIRNILLETSVIKNSMNQLTLSRLDPRAWRGQTLP